MAGVKHKPRVTIEEHVAMGNDIRRACKAVQSARLKYARTSEIGRAALSAEHALLKLRMLLDAEVQALVPMSYDPRGLATRVYTATGAMFVEQPVTNTRDGFAKWTLEETD